MIRIFVIDPHPTIIFAIRSMIHSPHKGIKMVGSANGIEDIILKVKPDDLDMFIFEIQILSGNPLDNVKMLKSNFPGKKIIIYTRDPSGIWLNSLIKEGIDAYLTKNADAPKVREAIHRVYNGENLAHTVAATGKTPVKYKGYPYDIYYLEPVQCQIIHLQMFGYSKKQIAEIAEISESKIKYLLLKARRQFKVNSTTGLIIKILKERISYFPRY